MKIIVETGAPLLYLRSAVCKVTQDLVNQLFYLRRKTILNWPIFFYMLFHICGILFSLLKGRNFLTFIYDINEPRRHCAKRNKPDTDKQIQHDSIYRWNLKKKVEIIVKESRMVVTRG